MSEAATADRGGRHGVARPRQLDRGGGQLQPGHGPHAGSEQHHAGGRQSGPSRAPEYSGHTGPKQRRAGLQIEETQSGATKRRAGGERNPRPREFLERRARVGREHARACSREVSRPSRRFHHRLGLSHPAPVHRADLADWNPERDLGLPGEPPYTRGIHPRCIASGSGRCGSSPASATRGRDQRRFRYLLAQGQTGFSVAFDLPTLMGYDSDHPLAEGEVGKCGVAISSLADMETLFDRFRWRTSRPR